MTSPIRTTCPYCGVGCGVIAQPADGGWVVRGDPDHPANQGRLCSKGAALGDTLGLETRLLAPTVDGRETDWSHALDQTAARIQAVIDRHGPDAFAFYLSGQLLSEDYYVANKLAKGFLGTANVDTNSRLCMASTVAGHRRAFGSDTVPGCYEDLEQADLVVLVGSNLAWCHPVLFQRLRRARDERGTKVVVIDPRRTDCCDIADLHLPLLPGSDVALFNGLLVACQAAGVFDHDFIARHTSGLEAALHSAAADSSHLLSATGLTPDDVARFYRLFIDHRRAVTVFSQGVNQSSAGTDKVNAILNVHLATGRIGQPGSGPFSVTGQPNAMGGREVGGLANQLAAHMVFDPPSIDRVGRFWQAPRMAQAEGLKAVDMFRAVDEGRIKAIWIMGTNPAVSLPEVDVVRRALAKCPLVIVSDCVADTDTLRHAHIRLPAHAWGEKNGTVTNSDRTISRQRPFLSPAGEAKSDWWAMSQVAARLGFGAAFAWSGVGQIFAEHAALSGFENNGSRDFDISDWADQDYDTLSPRQWGGQRMFADGQFFTPDRRARILAVSWRDVRDLPDSTYPLRLNTGRYRDQWHTMTRTGLSARLSGHRPQPLLDIHPDDARGLTVADGDLVRVSSRLGQYLTRLRVTTDQPVGQVYLPMHWTDVFAKQSVVGRLLAAHTDPVSGQPESKHMPVRIDPVRTAWSALLICAAIPDLSAADWWVRQQGDGGHILQMAGESTNSQAPLLAALDAAYGSQRLEVLDAGRGSARYAWFQGDCLVAALYLSPEPPNVVAGWVAGLIGKTLDSAADRISVLAGRAAQGQTESGPIICSCFSVGLTTIEQAIRSQGLTDVAQIGAALQAGTGCGSCIPELKSILARVGGG